MAGKDKQSDLELRRPSALGNILKQANLLINR
jgi:hypothetical protein